jgi:hypothetical protein
MGPIKGMGIFLALVLWAICSFLLYFFLKGKAKLIANFLTLLMLWLIVNTTKQGLIWGIQRFFDQLGLISLILVSLLVYGITWLIIFQVLKLWLK